MVFPVTMSMVPLVADTLPAVKTRFYVGSAPKIYTMARLYFQKNALQLQLNAFERQPKASSRVAFALAGDAGQMALVMLAPNNASLQLYPKEQPLSLWQAARAKGAALQAGRISGVDEQGWYWGAKLTVEAKMLQEVGITVADGAQFTAALLKFDVEDQTSLGASYPLAGSGCEVDARHFGAFSAVWY